MKMYSDADRLLGNIESRQQHSNEAFFTAEERQWIIGDDAAYFAEVRRSTEEKFGVQQSMFSEDALYIPTMADRIVTDTRQEKGDLFTDRLMHSVFGLDTLRTELRVLTSRPFVAVDTTGDDPDQVRHRSADYVTNALEGYLRTRLDPTGDKHIGKTALLEAFGNDTALTLRLTKVAARNQQRKAEVFASQYVRATAGGHFASRASDVVMHGYQNRERPQEYQGIPNILDIIVAKKADYVRRERARRRYQELTDVA